MTDVTGEDYLCPGCHQPVPITTTRQRRRIEEGGSVFHNRECQKAASSETRPCDACGEPVTRRKSEFTGEKVACSSACRGRLKSNMQTYQCEVCGTDVQRTPGNARDRVFCSRRCFGIGTRNLDRARATCAQKECAKEFPVTGDQAQRAAEGKPVYCSKECRYKSTHITVRCTSCGTPVERYRSQVGDDPSKSRSYCGPCRDSGAGGKPRKGTTRPCAACGKPVYRQPSFDSNAPRYCDHACRAVGITGERVERPERPCAVCGKVMRLEPDQVRQGVKTCSRDCANALRRRKPGERYIEPRSGYVRITAADGRDVLEHRYLMEMLLGRRLAKGENVHHIDGQRDNNVIDGPLQMVNGKLRSGNLELWSTSQPSGQEIGPKVEWALGLLNEYAEFLTDDQRASLAVLARGPVIRGELAPGTVLVPPAKFIQDVLAEGVVEEAERLLGED